MPHHLLLFQVIYDLSTYFTSQEVAYHFLLQFNHPYRSLCLLHSPFLSTFDPKYLNVSPYSSSYIYFPTPKAIYSVFALSIFISLSSNTCLSIVSTYYQPFFISFGQDDVMHKQQIPWCTVIYILNYYAHNIRKNFEQYKNS